MRLQEEGVSHPYELADTSKLDEACEVVTELKARQREQNRIAREAGIENKNINPLIDRHMDISVIKNLFFVSNLLRFITFLLYGLQILFSEALFC